MTQADKAELAAPKLFFEKVAELMTAQYGKPAALNEGVASAALIMAGTNAFLVDANKARVAQLSSAAGWQARGRRLEQVVSEHRSTMVVDVGDAQLQGLQRRQRLKAPLEMGSTTIPAKLQVFEIESATGGMSGSDSARVKCGIPWTPMEFLQKALCLQHPFAGTT